MKQKTMDTLLKKKDSRATKQIKTLKNFKEDTPKISYIANSSGFSLSFPSGHTFPLTPSVSCPPPPLTLCTMCNDKKKYNSSKTGQPVCSPACYKDNLARAAVSERYQYYHCQLLVCISMHKKCLNCNIYVLWQIIVVLHLVDFILFKTIFTKRVGNFSFPYYSLPIIRVCADF